MAPKKKELKDIQRKRVQQMNEIRFAKRCKPDDESYAQTEDVHSTPEVGETLQSRGPDWLSPASPDFPVSERYEAVLSFIDTQGQQQALVVAKSPRVLVCSACKELVSRGASHMNEKHSLEVPTDVFEALDLASENWYGDGTQVIDSIPFLKVDTGCRCPECKRCFLHAKNMTHLSSCKKLGVIEKGVKMQRVAGQGTALKAVAVNDMGNRFSMDGKIHDIDDVVRRLTSHAQKPTSYTHKEINGFYRILQLFVKSEDVEEFRRQRLDELFKEPKNVGNSWKSELYEILYTTFIWADTLDPAFKMTAWFRTISAQAKRTYIHAFISIINFQVNMSELGQIQTPFLLSYPFKQEVTNLVQAPSHKTFFDLIDKLMSQPISHEGKTVIDGMLRLYCVDSRSFTLRDPRYVQPFASYIMRLLHLAVLAGSGIACNVNFGHIDEVGARQRALEISSMGRGDWDSGSNSGSGDEDFESFTSDSSASDIADEGAESMRGSSFGEQLQLRAKFVDVNQLFPMKQVVGVWTLAKNNATPLDPRIVLTEDPLVLAADGIIIDMKGVSSLYLEKLTNAQRLAADLCLGCDTNFGIEFFNDLYHWESIKQKDQKNEKNDLQDRILRHILNDESLRKKFIVRVPDIGIPAQFSTEFTDKILEKVDELERNLVFLLYLGGGMPPRITELEHLTFCNVGDSRNVFLFNGLVYLEPNWSKNDWRKKKTNKLLEYPIRFLDKELSLLLLKNLFVIRPFINIVARSCQGTSYNGEFMSRLFMQKGGPMSYSFIQSQLARELMRVGVQGGARLWRQVSKAFMNSELVSGGEKRVLLNDTVCSQHGHSPFTGTAHYGRVQDVSANFNMVHLNAVMVISSLWHNILRVSQVLAECAASPPSLPPAPPSSAHVPAPPARPPAAPAAASPAGPIHESSVLGSSVVEGSLRMSSIGPLTSTVLFSQDNPFSTFAVQPRVEATDMSAILGRLPDGPMPEQAQNELVRMLPGAVWKSREQRQAVHLSLRSNSNLVCALPTNGGKSLTFFLFCAIYPEGVTLVLVPTRVLRDDIIRRARVFELRVSEGDGISESSKGLVVMCAERVEQCEEVRRTIRRLINWGKITRIFVDEFHAYLMEGYRFFLNTAALASDVPFTFLSATATKKICEGLKRMIAPIRPFQVIRVDVDRPNIELLVNLVRDSEKEPLLKSLIENCSGRALIFVRQQANTQEISQKIWGRESRCRPFHAGLSDLIKEAHMKMWIEGNIKALCATTALAAGLDCDKVRLVVVMGMPYSMEDYIQMIGRCGRDGLESRAVVMYSEKDIGDLVEETGERKNRQYEFVSFLESKKCRRATVSTFVGGLGSDCRGEGGSVCDNCVFGLSTDASVREAVSGSIYDRNFHGRDVSGAVSTGEGQLAGRALERAPASRISPPPPRYVNAVDQRCQDAMIESEIILEFINNWKGCTLCYVAGEEFDHKLEACDTFRYSQNCHFCVGQIPDALGRKHDGGVCPIRAKFHHSSGLCQACWLPGQVNGVYTHPASEGGAAFGVKGCGKSLSRFSLGLAWLYNHKDKPDFEIKLRGALGIEKGTLGVWKWFGAWLKDRQK